MRNTLLILGLLGIAGCATEQASLPLYTRPPNSVAVVSQLSANDALQFREIGPLECEALTHANNSDPEETCRNTLKQKAAFQNADLLVIERSDRIACQSPVGSTDCIRMKARSYLKIHEDLPPAPSVVETSTPPPPPPHNRTRSDVVVVSSVGPGYIDKGTVTCEEKVDMRPTNTWSPEEMCHFGLENAAFDKGADVVVVQHVEHFTCVVPIGGPGCVRMTGTAYSKPTE